MLNREPGFDDVTERWIRGVTVPPALPLAFRAEPEGSGIRLMIADQDHLVERSGTVRYVFGHASDGDMTTDSGRRAAASRAERLAGVDAPGTRGAMASTFLTDPRYQTGIFFCWGVGANGDETDGFLWTPKITREIADTTVPGDVSQPQISETGKTSSPGVVVSEISVSAAAPRPLGSFYRLKILLQHYHEVGSIVEGHSKVHLGDAGGPIQFQFDLAPFRKGVGAITLTPGVAAFTVAGGNLERQARTGDVIEALHARAEIASITDNENGTLVAPWSGPAVVALSDFQILPLVRFIFAAENRSGTRKEDLATTPSVEHLLDALLSAPNAPVITGTTLGNEILLEWPQVLGSEIVDYRVYRCDGQATPFADASRREIDALPHNGAAIGAETLLQAHDSKFDITDREQGSYFTYYVKTRNARGDLSAPSNAISLPCRSNGPADTTPSVVSRFTLRNLLYNAFFSGTDAAAVADTDAVQHDCNGTDGGNKAGKGYTGSAAADGLGRFLGYTAWHGRKSGLAAALPTFLNGDEVRLPAPGVAGEWCDVVQEIGAWDAALKQKRKIQKYGLYVLSIYAQRDNATVPNGSLELYLMQMDNGGDRGYCPRQYRDANNQLQYYTGAAAKLVMAGSDLLSDVVRFWATFKIDAALGTTRQLAVIARHVNSTSGAIRIKKLKLEESEVVTAWTGDMGDPSISYPVPGSGVPSVGDVIDVRNPDGGWERYQEP